MGLELEEIAMEVEIHFGVHIPDDDGVKIRTPRQLITYVENKLKICEKTDTPCETQVAFYKIRRLLTTRFKLKRETITPNLPLADILPNENKQTFLTEILNGLELKGGPQLNFPEEFERLVFYPFAVIFLITFICFAGEFNFVVGLAIALCFSWLPGHLICEYFDNKRTELSPSNFTIADLSYLLIAKENKESLKNNNVQWSKAKIEQDIKAIITQVLGISNFHLDSDFIDDLGAG